MIYLAHIILSLPVGLYHFKIGSPGEPAATTMSQTGCYMDVSFLMCLLKKMYDYMNLFQVTGCIYLLTYLVTYLLTHPMVQSPS